MKYKTAPARLKAADAAAAIDDGTFEAIVSVFGNVDSWGDVVKPGAFADTLDEWKASGDPIPVWWSHRMDDPMMNIGVIVEAEELAGGDARIPEWADQWVKDHGGLWVKGQIDTGLDATDKAMATHKLLRNRRVTQFSYAYDVIDSGIETVDGEDVYALRKLKLYEVSPTPIGANELTELIAAKARRSKSGRVLSAKNETAIRDAVALLDGVLSGLDEDGDDDDDSKSAKDEEPPRVKSEEPRMDAELTRLLTEIDLQQLDLV
jgi:phage head maturation protease